MRISGFTFIKNANKLYYPVKESILSVIDIVDEFVIALDNSDEGDLSLEMIKEINSDKIKIVNTRWDIEKYKNGSIYAQQTDEAKKHCTGDWLLYIQGDEAIHEDDLDEIVNNCKKYLNEPKVEGFVFNYLHFFGDYNHYFSDHCWYQNEIRIIRNLPEIHSWRDAQSFRWMSDFDGIDYHRKNDTRKLNCVKLNARIFHYGWVRPPEMMSKKNATVSKYYSNYQAYQDNFDYGRLDFAEKFTGTHPKVMKQKISEIYWQDLLRFSGPTAIGRPKMKHERPKYRILIWIEKNLLGGKMIGGFKNFRIV